jgi:alcohol dehydrogenase
MLVAMSTMRAATKLGAWGTIDSHATDPAAVLTKLGGAKVVLATITDGDAMSATIGGLAVNGTLMVLGGVRQMSAQPGLLLTGRRSIKGWYSGTAADSEDTMSFSALTGVRSMNEVFPLEKVAEAYDRMMAGHARFRAVLTMAP